MVSCSGPLIYRAEISALFSDWLAGTTQIREFVTSLEIMVRESLRLSLLLSLVSAAGSAAGMPMGSPPAEAALDQWVVRRWSVDDGLPSSSLNRVLAAADGYIWATSFTGLARFDGQGFTVFGQRDFNALATSGFVGISSGRDGRLWVGTQGDGPWWFDGQTLRPGHPELSVQGEVVSLLEDRQGVIWVGLQEPALLRIEGSDVRRVEDPALRDVLVRDIEQGSDGRLWIATRGKGLVACEARGAAFSCRSFTHGEGLPSDLVNAVAEGPSGQIWAATRRGLGRIDGSIGSGMVGSVVEEIPEVGIQDLAFGPTGDLWMATSKGVMRWHPRRREAELLERGAGLPLGDLTSMSFDHEGSLWLSSRNHGMFQLTSGHFSNFSTRDGLASERIHAAFDPGGGEIWVGTEAGRIQRIVGGGRVGEVPLATDLGGVQVMDFYRDRQGRHWISTYAGLLRLDGSDERLFGIEDGLPSLEVRWARQDRAGTLWVGTRSGVVRLGDDGRFGSEAPWGSVLDGISFSFDETLDGRLLFGARGGLVILHPGGEVETLPTGKTLPGSLVFSTHIDDAGAIWICTNGGLARYAEGEVAGLRESDGLPVPSIYDLEEDSLGFFWMTSAKGVLRVSRVELQAYLDAGGPAPRADLFGVADGLQNAECTGARKILRATDGHLWFPTLGGISSVDPESLTINPVPPPVRISAIAADGRPLDPHQGLVIPAGTRRLEFGFAALSYRFPSRVRVLYRLEGFDSGWMEARSGHHEAGRRAVYTNLSPGHYVLRVIAANNDDVWNEEGARLAFHIAPELHQTWWFRSLVLVLSGLAIGGLHLWRTRTLGARNRVLEQAAGERRRFIDQLAEKNRELELFASTVSHDLKGPLVTIEGFLGLLERDLESGNHERMRRDMARIRQGTQTMARLIEGLLEVSRIGRGEASMERVETSELAHRAIEQLAAQVAAAEVRVDVAEDLPAVFANAQQILQVFQNLIANGVKFMGAQESPRIEIGHRLQGQETVFFVCDNGVGIDPSQHSKIFGLFDRLDPEIEGSGLGLAIVQRVIEVHGGRVWVESEGAGRGSCFCFTLRLA